MENTKSSKNKHMEKIEILSPVGEKAGFFASIKSGADAVYMGLPKFNARMKAENITLEDLPELIKYAHLKNVKVYITMNTVLKNNEIAQAVAMAGECLNAGVDAFIVQDLGLISTLKNTYPNIVLHGSTQLGVHNVMGARVAKEMGLTRVVLSRECTLSDIEAISKNVDIELEVFVQGANCICFSGNCYLSSIKCGASGNRGECKQLCRLPYVLSDGKKSVKGYALSPRDNCLLDNLSQLISLGVSSLKIEGRLRNLGYIKVATSTYKNAISQIYLGKEVSIDTYKNNLKRVFARGEYVSGYNNGNHIIDIENNNHLGIKIGKVKCVSKFKDLYKIGMDLHMEFKQKTSCNPQNNIPIKLTIGDGLKFKNGNKIISLGVGNVEESNNLTHVFGKNHVDIGSDIYLAKDTTLENSVPDISSTREIFISAHVVAGEPITVEFSCGKCKVKHVGEVVELAQKKVIAKETIAEQLSKVDKDIFSVSSCDVFTQNAFVSLSTLNAIRRDLIEKLTSEILSGYSRENTPSQLSTTNIQWCNETNHLNTFDIKETPQDLLYSLRHYHPNRIAIVDESVDISEYVKYDGLMFAPSIYSMEAISKFYDKYITHFSSPLIINLPILARVGDIEIIDNIVSSFSNKKVIFVANNIYALAYARNHVIWAGAGLNVVNDKSKSFLKNLGVAEIIGSFEKCLGGGNDVYKISDFPLMTLTSCPIKVLYNNDCNACKFTKNLNYTGDGFSLKVRRVKIKNCYFELYNCNNAKDNYNVIDCRF